MTDRFPPIDPKHPHFLHGGDYNPEQWLKWPAIIEEDFRLAKLAHINTFTLGVFSWATLEPEEGRFEFDWLDRLLDRMAKEQMAAVLATPSGARPAWMSFKYPEVLRVQKGGKRIPHEGRHNHCFTSPIYHEKVRIIDTKLAERYHDHPALSIWHISNEFNGECHCDLCYSAFRQWVKKKYLTLDAVNEAWWSTFWSHTYTDWEQIEPVDFTVHGLALDWKRFVTDQTVDFMRNEISAVRQFSKSTPITTNMMGTFEGLNYWKFAEHLDVISWDAYPSYFDREDTVDVAVGTSFNHDLNRSMKGKPFMLIESSPSATNWVEYSRLKSPGMHKLASLQAVAHGADTVQYFQMRKNRGSVEKFHGAVIDHAGHENTRVFREVSEVGEILSKLDNVIGTTTPAEVAIIYDWENRWALEAATGPAKEKNYVAACVSHYKSFWQMGISTDVINADQPLHKYKIIVAPMLYMIRPGVAERIEAFVKAGGTFVATYLTGIANETDLCFLGGWPGPLRNVLGIWSEEIQPLFPDEKCSFTMAKENPLAIDGMFSGKMFCDVIHAESATVLATYDTEFYAGRPVLTVNSLGSGKAYYLATYPSDDFLFTFYKQIAPTFRRSPVVADLPKGVTLQHRTGDGRDFWFLLNFTRDPQPVTLIDNVSLEVIGSTKTVSIPAYGVQILESTATSSRS